MKVNDYPFFYKKVHNLKMKQKKKDQYKNYINFKLCTFFSACLFHYFLCFLCFHHGHNHTRNIKTLLQQ